MRLVDPDLLDRQHGVEHLADPGVGDGGIEHRRRAVRQDGGGQPGHLQPAQHLRDLGEGV